MKFLNVASLIMIAFIIISCKNENKDFLSSAAKNNERIYFKDSFAWGSKRELDETVYKCVNVLFSEEKLNEDMKNELEKQKKNIYWQIEKNKTALEVELCFDGEEKIINVNNLKYVKTTWWNIEEPPPVVFFKQDEWPSTTNIDINIDGKIGKGSWLTGYLRETNLIRNAIGRDNAFSVNLNFAVTFKDE